MKIGSLFSGIGAMDQACEQHFGARTVWHVERDAYCRSILARHWPDAERFDDVMPVGASNLEPVDILIGGPPCVDLSVAGQRKGLHADRSGLFFELVRIAAELKPAIVVVENVPALLRDWRGTVESAMAGAGYGVTWTLMTARHAGAPHLRWRVVLLCRRGGRHMGVCHPPEVPELGSPGRLWPTLPGAVGAVGGASVPWERVPRCDWPTPPAALADDEGFASYFARRERAAQSDGGVFSVHLGVAARLTPADWPTPTATLGSGDSECFASFFARRERVRDSADNVFSVHLGMAARLTPADWPTPTAHDAKDTGHAPSEGERNAPGLPSQVATANPALRLSARWVEGLQGLPHGWTTTDEPLEPSIWPAPRLGDLWGASPQYDGEPPRVILPSEEPKRRARLRALGNACPPAQYLAALALAEAGPRQQSLL